MGREVEAEASEGRLRVAVKAELSNEAITLRRGIKRTLPLSGLKATVKGDDLILTPADGPKVTLHLGAKEGAAWLKKIENPPGLTDRMGLKPGQGPLVLIGAPPPELAADALAAKGFQSQKATLACKAFGPGLIPILTLRAGDDLATKLSGLAARLSDDAATFVVFPKGKAGINDNDLIKAARAAGLKDTRVIKVSASHTAQRFLKREH